MNQKLIDKIQKLLNKARGTDNQAEAETFMAKVNELLLQHNLTMTEVEATSGENAIGCDKHTREFGEKVDEGVWEPDLAFCLARFNLCKAITTTWRGEKVGKLSFIGSKQNVQLVEYMYDAAREIIRGLARKAYNDYVDEKLKGFDYKMMGKTKSQTVSELKKCGHITHRNPWIRSYLKGAVEGLELKFERERRKFENENGDKFGLMIVANREALEKFSKDMFGDIKGFNSPNANVWDAREQGIRDGANLSIAKGVDGKGGQTQKRIG